MCVVLWFQLEYVRCLVVSVGRYIHHLVYSSVFYHFFLLFVLNSVVVERGVAQHSSLAGDSLLLKFIISKVYNTCVYTHQANKLGHIIMLHLRTN